MGARLRRRALKFMVSTFDVVGAVAPTAASNGLPVPVDQTWGDGVVSADGDSRFVALPAGDRTLVMRSATDGGQVEDSTVATGDFGVPAIAVDGTASGISADGGTLA